MGLYDYKDRNVVRCSDVQSTDAAADSMGLAKKRFLHQTLVRDEEGLMRLSQIAAVRRSTKVDSSA